MWTDLQPNVVTRLPRHGCNGARHAGIATAEPEHTVSHDWEERIQEIKSYRTYQDDWDGQGAVAPTPALLQSAADLAVQLRRSDVDAPCRAVVSVNGTIVFEWQWPDGAYLEIEVIAPGHADACLILPGQPTETWTLQ